MSRGPRGGLQARLKVFARRGKGGARPDVASAPRAVAQGRVGQERAASSSREGRSEQGARKGQPRHAAW